MELLRKERNEGNKKAAADRVKIDRLKKKIQCIEERNGILKDTEELKYKEHCMKVKTIIEKHQSLNDLKDTRNMYEKSKKRKHKEAIYDMNTYYYNMKKIRGYEEEKEVKSSEKFEIFPDYMSTQESRSTNEEEIQSNTFRGIGSRIVDISIPEIFEEEVEEESVCFNCHRMQHSFYKEKFRSGYLKIYLCHDLLSPYRGRYKKTEEIQNF